MGPVGEDPRWEVFAPFHEYLEKAFPLVYVLYALFATFCSSASRYSNLKVSKVNTYGLVYEWEGTSPGLKPILLAAHQGMSRS
jgi:Gly-Xaa carboxypeptidase